MSISVMSSDQVKVADDPVPLTVYRRSVLE